MVLRPRSAIAATNVAYEINDYRCGVWQTLEIIRSIVRALPFEALEIYRDPRAPPGECIVRWKRSECGRRRAIVRRPRAKSRETFCGLWRKKKKNKRTNDIFEYRLQNNLKSAEHEYTASRRVDRATVAAAIFVINNADRLPYLFVRMASFPSALPTVFRSEISGVTFRPHFLYQQPATAVCSYAAERSAAIIDSLISRKLRNTCLPVHRPALKLSVPTYSNLTPLFILSRSSIRPLRFSVRPSSGAWWRLWKRDGWFVGRFYRCLPFDLWGPLVRLSFRSCEKYNTIYGSITENRTRGFSTIVSLFRWFHKINL